MNKKIKAGIAALVLGVVGYNSLFWIDKKEVGIYGYDSEQTDITPPQNVPFNQDILEALVEGEDIIPGLPEPGAVCAKAVRVLANTALDEPYFTRPRHISKATYKITGQTELAGDSAGINGDAWHMFSNIQEAGGRLLYFSQNPKQDAEVGFDFLQDNAQIGDIVGFYYPDSGYNDIAKKAGPGFTHMGLVVGYDIDSDDGSSDPIVAHLFHSDQYFAAEEIPLGDKIQKGIQAKLYGVTPAKVPAFRVETVNFIRNEFTYPGSKFMDEDQAENSDANYIVGDPLIYVAAVLRPNYEK